MSVPDAQRLKEFETENQRLEKLLAESLLENEVAREVLRKEVVTATERRDVLREMVTRGLSERRALTVVQMGASGPRYVPRRIPIRVRAITHTALCDIRPISSADRIRTRGGRFENSALRPTSRRLKGNGGQGYEGSENRMSGIGAVAAIFMPATSGRAADATDKVTGLPLHPGLDLQQQLKSSVCGHPADMVIYDPPGTATLAEYITWYRGQLKDSHYVHQVWNARAQELFYSGDGSRGVSLRASQSGPGIFAVTYMKMSVPLTTAQMDAFRPSNTSCK
jgi:hypothetical protein